LVSILEIGRDKMDQGLGYIAAAILGALIANGVQIYRDIEKTKKQNKDNKIRTINGLRGVKHTMLQSKASYYSTFSASESILRAAHMLAVHSIDYNSIRAQRTISGSHVFENAQQYVNNIIDENLRNSLELKEYFRLKQRAEELQLEIAKNDERFWRIIGRIRILFPNDKVGDFIDNIKNLDQELGKFEEEIIESIDPIRTEISIKPGFITSNAERNAWTRDITIKLGEWNSSQRTTLKSRIDAFDSKIDSFLTYLEDEFNNPHCRDCRLFCSNKMCPLDTDYILWILKNSSGKMKRSELQQYAGLREKLLDRTLRELARENRIRITGEVISLI
jgi:hypothetical protein